MVECMFQLVGTEYVKLSVSLSITMVLSLPIFS